MGNNRRNPNARYRTDCQRSRTLRHGGDCTDTGRGAGAAGPQNPAVKDMHQNNSPVPVAGANSFTMGEAKSHIEARGFTNVKDLKKDASGVWRGSATKGGASVPVSLDYQGNVH